MGGLYDAATLQALLYSALLVLPVVSLALSVASRAPRAAHVEVSGTKAAPPSWDAPGGPLAMAAAANTQGFELAPGAA